MLNSLIPIEDYLKTGCTNSNEEQNIIIFSGINPFVGVGQSIPKSRWSIPIVRKKINDSLDYVDIEVKEFYTAVDEKIRETNLPNLEIFSNLLVDGFELDTNSNILIELTSTPGIKTIENPLDIQETKLTGGNQRSYRVYRYVDKARDYVFSLFLRFHNSGNITFIDSSGHILTGIDRQRFSLASVAQDNQIYSILKTLAMTIVLFPGIYIGVALYYLAVFLSKTIKWMFNDWKQKSLAKFQEEYDYGRDITFRELIAEPLYGTGNRRSQIGSAILYFLKSFIGTPLGFIITIALTTLIIVLSLSEFTSNTLSFAMKFSIAIYLVSLVFIFIVTPSSNIQPGTVSKVNYDFYGTQDMLMYWKTLQKVIIKTTIDLLKDKEIDVSDFEEATNTIINNVTTVTASNISNSPLAVGSDSSFSQSIDIKQS